MVLATTMSNPPEAETVPSEDAIRGNTYALLAALLASPPDQCVIDRLRRVDIGRSEAGTPLEGAWRALHEAAETATPVELDDEYHALFVGLGRGELIPYGSWYIAGFMMDQPLAELRADLSRLGFERREKVFETEDHACAQLEIMAMLIGEGESLTEQRRLFARHLQPWMRTFFRDLRDARSAAFYRAVGEFGEQFMEFEQQYLMMLR